MWRKELAFGWAEFEPRKNEASVLIALDQNGRSIITFNTFFFVEHQSSNKNNLSRKYSHDFRENLNLNLKTRVKQEVLCSSTNEWGMKIDILFISECVY